MTLLESILELTSLKSEAEIVSTLHGNDFYLPIESIQHAKSQILSSMIFISIVNVLLFTAFSASSATKNRANRLSYQLSHFSMNLFLGIYGVYFWFSKVPGMRDVSTSDKVDGFVEDITIFANAQIGYNLWAIPAGAIVKEKPIMIVHHFAVLCVASISTFLTNGFRYYTPFFYGAIEISSIPLTVMNVLKDNKDWQALFPTTNIISRLTFALSFLTFRVICWIPLIFDYLKHLSLILITSDDSTEIVIFSSMCISALALTYLQLGWGTIIVKGLIGHFSPKNKDKKSD